MATHTDLRRGFHDHLDVCEQCRNHPFSLCPVGEEILAKSEEGNPWGIIPLTPLKEGNNEQAVF